MKNIQGLNRVCLFDPATGDRVLLKALSPDSDVNKEPIPTETAVGAICGGHTHTAEIVFFDLPEGARTQLEEWENSDTEINAVMLTSVGVLLWSHPTTISGFVDSLATNARDGVSPYRVEMIAVGHDLDIYYGINFFRSAIKRRDDGRTEYDPTEAFSPLRMVQGGLFKLGAAGSAAGTETTTITEAQNNIKFPFPVDVPFNVLAASDVTTNFQVIQENFAGTVLASDTVVANKQPFLITPNPNLYRLSFEFDDSTPTLYAFITAGLTLDDWEAQ